MKTKVFFRLSGLVFPEIGLGSVLGRIFTTPSVGSFGEKSKSSEKGRFASSQYLQTSFRDLNPVLAWS